MNLPTKSLTRLLGRKADNREFRLRPPLGGGGDAGGLGTIEAVEEEEVEVLVVLLEVGALPLDCDGLRAAGGRGPD